MRALATQRAFGSSALSYGSTVFPLVARELSRWHARAARIPNAGLRRLALAALGKRGNMQGAALFAVLAPRAGRAKAARSLVAFQAAYNYTDMLAEQPSADPVANGRELHRALLDALDPCAERSDYYARYPDGDGDGDGGGSGDGDGGGSGDGGYLLEMVDTARACLSALPSYALVARPARAAAARIVDFQSLNLGERQGGHDGLEHWAGAQPPPDGDLRWWETAAAAGSSLGVHVLIGLAAQPRLEPEEIAAVERAYYPWIGALHSLLDSLVDVAEDRREGQRNLLGYYPTRADAAARMGALTARAGSEARALARGQRHQMIVTAMVSYYLSAAAASAPRAQESAAAEHELQAIATSVADAAGPTAKRALALFNLARLASRGTPVHAKPAHMSA